MNILMLNYEFPPIGGGASPVSYDIGKGLVALGHKVTVVTMAYKDLPAYEEKDGMAIYRVKCWRTQKMVCHPWEQATYILSAMHFIKHKLHMEDYDICYTHFIIPTGPIAWWIKKKYKLPYVITSHGSDVIGHNNKRFKTLYALVRKPWCAIVREASCVVSPSKYLMELMKKNEPNGKYQLIQNGIDTSFFQKAEEKLKKILIMCRLQETKNVQCIIKALNQIDLKDWHVDILGDGPYKEILQQMVLERNLNDKVSFKGWVTNKSEEHLKILQEASIYISASRVENCPTSILEAMACGANVILSDIPAHRQLVESVDQDVFFKMEDDKELADKLNILISKLDKTNKFANEYNISCFDWKESINKYEQLLDTLRNK